MRVDVEIFESGNKKLKKYPDTRGRGLSYIVKLPDEVCASYTKRVGDNKKILPLKKLAKVLLTVLSF